MGSFLLQHTARALFSDFWSFSTFPPTHTPSSGRSLHLDLGTPPFLSTPNERTTPTTRTDGRTKLMLHTMFPRTRTPRAAVLFSFFVFLLLALSAAAETTTEKRQTSAAPSFRFSVHTHSESAVKYAISPTYVSLFIGGASVLIAGLMI
ncbi:hypothetical protein FN846DRAFT_972131 [Sphaerosporella brunnea]|uniref:Uncharacterized protein n=1 Tax=Sphaerosporella brunnea TaxID=1250544 RepID=A0A5J5EIR5_9PEZI|nr:hypothetical protein FN846DRAFT_972131 [Sphaerosporella brunnea]